MGSIPATPSLASGHFSGTRFALVVLIHAAVLSLTMQSRSTATPVFEEVLTLSVLPSPTAMAPPVTRHMARPVLTSLPPLPALLLNTLPAEASISVSPPAITSNPVSQAAPVTQPRFDADYLDNPSPPYPPLSRRIGEQGRVVLRVHVLPNGQADEIHIHISSNSSRLDQSARETVGRWRFLPARRGEETIAAWVLVPIAFSLNT